MSGFQNKVVFSEGSKITPTSSGSRADLQQDSTDVARINYTGNPEGVISANPASLCHDPVSGLVYKKDSGVGNTGWSQLGGAGTITGSTGGALSQTSGNWNIVAGGNAGASVKFDGASSTLSLNVSNSNDSIFLGRVSGAAVSGTNNVGVGVGTLQNINGSGQQNTAVGFVGLNQLTSGAQNTSVGYNCLTSGTTFGGNTGVGSQCLTSCTGDYNVGVGWQVLQNLTSGAQNVVVGHTSGFNYTGAESHNVLIKNIGIVGESGKIRIGDGNNNACFIAGITGVTITGGATVLCDGSGQLGTVVSSERYKENIKDVTDETSILDLKSVQFNYKADESKTKVFGFIAEEVEKILPELCIYNEKGMLQTVKYHEMPALLLKEIQRLNERLIALETQYKNKK